MQCTMWLLWAHPGRFLSLPAPRLGKGHPSPSPSPLYRFWTPWAESVGWLPHGGVVGLASEFRQLLHRGNHSGSWWHSDHCKMLRRGTGREVKGQDVFGLLQSPPCHPLPGGGGSGSAACPCCASAASSARRAWCVVLAGSVPSGLQSRCPCRKRRGRWPGPPGPSGEDPMETWASQYVCTYKQHPGLSKGAKKDSCAVASVLVLGLKSSPSSGGVRPEMIQYNEVW